MKYFSYIPLFVFMLLQPAYSQTAFTVEEAIAYARDQSAGVQNSRLGQQLSATKAERLQRSWLPQVSASANVRYNPILQTTLLPAELTGGPGGELIEVQFGTDFSSMIGLTVSQKVFDPIFRLEQELRELEGQGAALREKYERELAAARVWAAYHQALIDEEIYRNSLSLLESLGKLREDVRVQVENELESSSLLNTLNQQYRQQQNKARVDSLNWQASLAGLKLEMHLPAEEALRLTDTIRLPMEDTLRLNTADNYDIRNYGLQLEESRNAMDRLDRSKLPVLSAEGYLGAQFFSNSPDLYNFSRWYGQSYIGLTASVPLYDGNDRSYGAQIENLRMEQVRNQMRVYRIEQENKAVQAALQLESARARAALAQEGVRVAEENLKLARINYQNEVAGFQPVFDALQTLVSEREQLLIARASYVQARLEARLLDL